MKRHLKKRVTAAAVLVGIAAAVSACGHNDNNANAYNPFGLNGASLNTSMGGCSVAFQGMAYVDQLGQINAQQLSVQPQPGQAQGGSFTYGRIGTDGTILEFNFSSNYGGYGGGYGAQGTISGVLSISQMQASTLMGYLGGGYGGGYNPYGGSYGYGMGGCPPITSLMLQGLYPNSAASASQIVGNQPFQWIVSGGQVLLNNSIQVYPY